MTNNDGIIVRLSSSEDERRLRETHAHAIKAKMSEEYFTGMKKFPEFSLLEQNLKERISRMISLGLSRLGINPKVDAELNIYDDCLKAAEYKTSDGSDDFAPITLNLDSIIRAFYKPKSRGSFFNVDVLQGHIEHELRHHLDRSFLTKKIMPQNIDESCIPFDVYLFSSLIGNREEGFASFGETKSEGEFGQTLINHTKTINYWLKFMEQKAPYDIRKGHGFYDSDALHLKHNGSPGGRIKRLDYWAFPDKYNQGPLFMEVIALAKEGRIGTISPDVYRRTLAEVKDMSLFDFYKNFYASLKQLGLNCSHAIYPERKSLKAIEKYAGETI